MKLLAAGTKKEGDQIPLGHISLAKLTNRGFIVSVCLPGSRMAVVEDSMNRTRKCGYFRRWVSLGFWHRPKARVIVDSWRELDARKPSLEFSWELLGKAR